MHKALFLDRDGVINFDYGYVYKIEHFDFIDGIFNLCELAQKKGYLIIVITNQSGISRGYFGENDFINITQYMCREFSKRGINITDVFHCPDLQGINRKPNPGMFLEAQHKYNIDMAASISVGDNIRDIEAAKNAGVGTNIIFKNNFDEVINIINFGVDSK